MSIYLKYEPLRQSFTRIQGWPQNVTDLILLHIGSNFEDSLKYCFILRFLSYSATSASRPPPCKMGRMLQVMRGSSAAPVYNAVDILHIFRIFTALSVEREAWLRGRVITWMESSQFILDSLKSETCCRLKRSGAETQCSWPLASIYLHFYTNTLTHFNSLWSLKLDSILC